MFLFIQIVPPNIFLSFDGKAPISDDFIEAGTDVNITCVARSMPYSMQPNISWLVNGIAVEYELVLQRDVLRNGTTFKLSILNLHPVGVNETVTCIAKLHSINVTDTVEKDFSTYGKLLD